MFVVTDGTEQRPGGGWQYLLLDELPHRFGRHLRSFGALDGERQPEVNTSGWSPETEFVSLPNIPGPAKPGGAGKWYQWLKVREAFKLMELEEQRRGVEFEVVIKLRTDATPVPTWSVDFICETAQRPMPLRIFAATDHIFWGPRNAFKHAADIFDGIDGYFLGSHPDALHRPFDIKILLDSMKSTPELAWKPGAINGDCWFFYNKLSMMPFPRMVPGDREPADMMVNLQAALDAGYVKVNDAPTVEWGARCGGAYAADRAFMTEKSMLDYILHHDVTICDLSTNTTDYLYKSRMYRRPAPVGTCLV